MIQLPSKYVILGRVKNNCQQLLTTFIWKLLIRVEFILTQHGDEHRSMVAKSALAKSTRSREHVISAIRYFLLQDLTCCLVSHSKQKEAGKNAVFATFAFKSKPSQRAHNVFANSRKNFC